MKLLLQLRQITIQQTNRLIERLTIVHHSQRFRLKPILHLKTLAQHRLLIKGYN